MKKYLVAAGSMWVSSVDGIEQESGQITEIKTIELTSDKSKAKLFNSEYGAKSTANKIKSYGIVVSE